MTWRVGGLCWNLRDQEQERERERKRKHVTHVLVRVRMRALDPYPVAQLSSQRCSSSIFLWIRVRVYRGVLRFSWCVQSLQYSAHDRARYNRYLWFWKWSVRIFYKPRLTRDINMTSVEVVLSFVDPLWRIKAWGTRCVRIAEVNGNYCKVYGGVANGCQWALFRNEWLVG